MIIAGLTGGVGCGKSSVLEVFAGLGWATASADAFCHQIYSENNPDFTGVLSSRWGNGIFNAEGEVDRKAVAGKVFGNEAELKWLNALIHPLIRKKIEAFITRADSERIMIEVPLLFETGWESFFNIVIAVWADETTCERRLTGQRRWNRAHIAERRKGQFSTDLKLERADYAIINNSSREILIEQCKQLNFIIQGTTYGS